MKNQKAFTLIELLIAAIIGICLLSVIALSVSTFLRSWSFFICRMERLEASRFAVWKIASEIRNCESLKPESNANMLVLSIDGKEVAYDCFNDKLRRRIDGYATYLTETGKISGLRFSYPSSGLVKFELSVADRWSDRLFTAEAALRN